jgi:peptidoglycan/LPS O-acetylase OafA/YrhL
MTQDALLVRPAAPNQAPAAPRQAAAAPAAPRPAAPREAFYIPSLDGLRAAAVLLVFAAHSGLPVPIPGNFGVTIFFFLSGYLITTLLRMELERTGGIKLGAFYLRRALRILPPFLVVLVGASAVTMAGALEGAVKPGAFLAQLLQLNNYYIVSQGWWDGRAPGTWVFWSLSVEEHFYLLFPFVFTLLWHRLPIARQRFVALGALCAIVLLWRCLLVFALDAPKDRTYVATDTRIDSILFGCMLAVFGNPMLDSTRIGERWWKWALLPLGVAGLVISFAVKSPQFLETFRYSLQGLALFPVFVVAVRYPTWSLFRLLNVRWVKFVGVLSYALYLLHPTVIFGVQKWLKWPLGVQAVVALALSLALALAIYYAVEQPSARLKKELLRRRSKARPRPGLGGIDRSTPAPVPSTV